MKYQKLDQNNTEREPEMANQMALILELNNTIGYLH